MIDLSQRMKERRLAAKMSQTDLSKIVGVSKVAVSQWENGDTQPKGDNLLKLAAAIGVTPQWLLNGDDTGVVTAEMATVSSNPKLTRLIHSLEHLEKTDSLPPGLIEALQKTVDVVSQQSKKSPAPPTKADSDAELARLNKELFGD